MGCNMKHKPGQPCCSACTLMPTDVTHPDAGFASMEQIQGEWSLRAGSWDDVSASSSEMHLEAGGVQLLVDARPNYSPYGVTFTVQFRGRDTSVIRFFAGADDDVSVSAEVTLGEDCGQLRFYEESIASETRIGDIHWIRGLRGEELHTLTLCYDATRGYLTATILTHDGETFAYSVQIEATGQTGYGVGTATDTAEFYRFAASALNHLLTRKPGPCGGVAIETVRDGVAPTESHVLRLDLVDDAWCPWSGSARLDMTWGVSEIFQVSISDPCTITASELAGIINGALPAGYSLTVAEVDGVMVVTLDGDFLNYDNVTLCLTRLTGGNSETVSAATSAGANEQQRITVTGNADSGTWSLTFEGQTTETLAPDADAATIQAALEALSNIGAGNVSVSGTDGDYTVEFIGSLAETDVAEMTTTYSFSGCDCTYDVYGYPSDCLKTCATCDPSCSLAGSPFLASAPDCDWINTGGYVFTDGAATGTGVLQHRTEIYTAPYVLSAYLLAPKVGYTYTANADDVAVSLVVYQVDGYNYGDVRIDGVTLDTFSFGLGVLPTAVLFSVCRYQAAAVANVVWYQTLNGGIAKIQAAATAFSGPALAGVDTDDPAAVWGSFQVARQKAFYSGCTTCIGDCTTCDPAHKPPDVILADLTDCVFGVGPDNAPALGCTYCPTIAAVWPLQAPTSDDWCRWTAVVLNVCSTGITSPCPAQLSWYVTLLLESHPTNGTIRWHLYLMLGPAGFDPACANREIVPRWDAEYTSDYFADTECDVLPRDLNYLSSNTYLNPACTGTWPATVTIS